VGLRAWAMGVSVGLRTWGCWRECGAAGVGLRACLRLHAAHMMMRYYRGAAAAVLVYDVTQASTFERLKAWVDELREEGASSSFVITAHLSSC
jgi:GTPase SAR1 family protein